ncbi:hypothetical protein [Sphingomonas crocodyli]|uniref:hypothetical protein n=1 Tax=Sphingomonas crocodyli TaxID=1979270 RepID=UPI0013E328A1|nr:hypothetical protein [Sphingomonas crocodyli]
MKLAFFFVPIAFALVLLVPAMLREKVIESIKKRPRRPLRYRGYRKHSVNRAAGAE